MFKKLALVFLWLLITPSLILLLSLNIRNRPINDNLPSIPSSISSGEIQIQNNTMEGQVIGVAIEDFRPFIVANFLNNTRLEPYSNLMIEVADKYQIDWRLIPAIAMKESGGGNAVREETHNAWGWENGRTHFTSWESAIETVGKTLKVKYADRGLRTPEEIMPVYAPPQIFTGGKWAKDINYFYSQMEPSSL